MTIDTGALRKFQEVWGPAVAAIPAVLDMVEREADLDRALQIKASDLAKAQKEIDAAYAEADQRLQALNNEMTASIEARQAVVKEIADGKAKARQEYEALEKQKQDMLSSMQAQIVSTQTRLDSLAGEYAAKKAKAEADHAEAVKAMNAEIVELNAKKAAAEQALADLKAKLG